MSHPYLCPSAWISTTVALQKAGFGYNFRLDVLFLLPRPWHSRHQNHRSRKQSGFRVHRDEEALMCRFVCKSRRRREKEGCGFLSFFEFIFCDLFLPSGWVLAGWGPEKSFPSDNLSEGEGNARRIERVAIVKRKPDPWKSSIPFFISIDRTVGKNRAPPEGRKKISNRRRHISTPSSLFIS